ncbi:hypothetical protein [Bradyrhizobium japonicum]|uniref:hypothetical protein n=1 Tax=Bradyrhizobium japonicum TaxID=375 RepID=UPI002010B7E6|nr:hypothetical protein [Bradyrhizobium japonicum]UQD96757.1 hypothetical protein JEY30_35210 [Bradyrhizobium japonicum]
MKYRLFAVLFILCSSLPFVAAYFLARDPSDPLILRPPFDHHTNYAYVVGVAAGWSEVDDEHGEQSSTIEVYENGVRLGPAHSSVSDVVMIGGGRYRYMEVDSVNHTSGIIFSTSDNTDPNTNGRLYRVFNPNAKKPHQRAPRQTGLPD